MSEQKLPLLDPQKGTWDEEAISRRRFLELGFWAATSTASVVVGGAGTGFLVGDALKAQPEQWVTVGPVVDLAAGQVHQARYTLRTQDAWREVERKGLLYAFSDDGTDYTVLDATCTHLGCNVQWQEEPGKFACPCHSGSFLQTGEVLSGPPPAPLRRLQTKIENGLLLALV